jgi:8-oxo-dGTP pyrophosphatase MutT (NUDIX family)
MPEAIVAVVISSDQFLVIRRAGSVADGGKWGAISGKMEIGESQEAAVVREVQEEVGLEIRPVRKVAVVLRLE